MPEGPPLASVLAVAARGLEPQALGELTALLTDEFCGAGLRHAQRLVEAAGLEDLLLDADFVLGLGGRTRLKSTRLIAWAFGRAPGVASAPAAAATSAVINRLQGLAASGALNVFSTAAAEALWRHAQANSRLAASTVLRAEMLGRLCGETESLAYAGLFLGVVLKAAPRGLLLRSASSASSSSSSSAAPLAELLLAIASRGDVRGLDGRPEQLLEQLELELAAEPASAPALAAAVAQPELRAQLLAALAVGGSGDEDDDDADEDGNLRGFINDGEEDEDADADEEDAEGAGGAEGAGAGAGASTEDTEESGAQRPPLDSASRERKLKRKRKRERKRNERAAAAAARAGPEEAESGERPQRKKLRRVGEARPARAEADEVGPRAGGR